MYQSFDIVKEADTIQELCDKFVLKVTLDGKTEYQDDERIQLLKIRNYFSY